MPDLDTGRQVDEEPDHRSPSMLSDFDNTLVRFQPVSGLVHGRVRRGLAAADDPLGGTMVPGSTADRLARPPTGSSLPSEINDSFGPQLGADLSGVRVHADAAADDLARSVAAKAFTVGSDIYFARGSYSTTSESGRHLLAHELTHVLQNRQAPTIPGPAGITIGRADDPAERHADRVAGEVLTALRRRAVSETSSAATTVEPSTAAPGEGFRGLQRRQARTDRSAVGAVGAVVLRMTSAVATRAKVEEKSVWVRDKNGRWVPGRIRELTGAEDSAVVELADGSTVTVPLADINDTPPPDAGLADAGERQLALRPEGGALTTTGPSATTSPEVQELFLRLSELSEERRKAEVRRLLFATHPDKVGSDDAFKVLQTVLDLFRSAQAPSAPAEQLMLTHDRPDLLAQPELVSLHLPRLVPPVTSPPKVDPGRELPAQPFSAVEIGVLTALPQVKSPADLQRLASTGRPAAALAAIAGLRTVTTLDGIVIVAGLGRTIGQLTELVELTLIRDITDLVALAESPYPCARLMALGRLRQVQDRQELLQLAALGLADVELCRLAGVGQATQVGHLQRLAALTTSHSVDLILAIGKLQNIQITTVADIADLAVLGRTVIELQELASLPLVIDASELVLLVNTGSTNARLTTFAAFTQVGRLAELLEVTSWPHNDVDVCALAGVGLATTFDHLRQLHALVGVLPVADIVAIAAVPTVTSVSHIAMLAPLGRTPGDLQQLATMPLVTTIGELVQVAGLACPVASIILIGPRAASLADLTTLCGAVSGTRTANDVFVIAGLGSATFAAPTAAQVVLLCGLAKTAAQIAQLSTAAGVTDAGGLIALANRTDTKEKVDAEWSVIDNRWHALKDDWRGRWPLTTLFGALDAHWGSLAPVMQRLPRAKSVLADPNDLQAYAMSTTRMTSVLDLIDQLEVAVDEGMAVLADADNRLAALANLVTEIDNQLIPFYPAPSAARTTVDNQRLAAVNARLTLTAERAQILIERGNLDALGALTAADVNLAALAQHNHTIAIGAVPTHATINAPLGAVRTPGYTERLTYPNLNLSRVEIGNVFWQSLLPASKVRFNAKLAGCTVTGWTNQGHPGPARRARQNGYLGWSIMIPTLQGWPCEIGGEVVHDWIFGTVANHGHAATVMLGMVNKALNGQVHMAGPNFPVNPTAVPQADGKTLYSWNNTQISIIIKTNVNPPVLITYFNPH